MKLDEYFLILKRLLLALTLYPAVRVFFLFFNFETYNNLSVDSFLYPLFYGLRFDFATLLIFNAIFIIFSLIPFRGKVYNLFLKIIFVFSNFVAIAINIVDLEFFKFNGKRFTADIFGIAGDMSNQAFQIILNYWYFVFLILLTFIFYWKLYPSLGKYQNPRVIRYRWTPIIGLIVLVFTFIGIRGGIQIRSISPKSAYVFNHFELGHLALNSAYTLIRSLGAPKLKKVRYFSSDEVAVDIIRGDKETSDELKSFTGKSNSNVIIIIVESLSQEYVDDGYAPFFKSLASKGLYLSRNFANGRRSIEALPSILVGMPSLLDKPLYQSQFQTNKFYSLASILKEKGYGTSFFHGGKTGTMDFDAYTSSIGFEKYFGMEDYPDQNNFDGSWGIYDDKFLNWFGKKLDEEKEPFVSTVFTLSSHQPYSIPKKFKNRFPKGTLEIHESIGYADESLRLFFESIKSKSWYKNTLFVITADHTQKTKGLKYNKTLGKYRVPLLFFHPDFELKNIDSLKTSQHVDILPSVLDFLGINQKQKLLYGASVFKIGSSPVINYINRSYILFHENVLLRLSDQKLITYEVSENLLSESQASIDSTKSLELLKAYIQYSTNGLIKNNLYR